MGRSSRSATRILIKFLLESIGRGPGGTAMTPSVQTGQPRTFAMELDVLRGFAAILMIVNHAGFRLLSASDSTISISAVAVFLGGFAPVVFFFATGFGIALTSGTGMRESKIAPLMWKAMLLVVADQFFFWRLGIAWGIDFFSFIALATVTVSLVARVRQSLWLCVALILLLLGLRYGLGPVLRPYTQESVLVDWLLGVKGIANVSYPLSPWMVYPLLGFVLGRMYEPVKLHSAQPRNNWLRSGLAVTFGLFGASLLLAILNSGFFRWGTVSFAFFVLSLGILGASGLVSVYLAMSYRGIARVLALRGVSSFAVIPLHYAMLDTYVAFFPVPVDQWAFPVLAVIITFVSFRAALGFSVLMLGEWVAKYRSTLRPSLLLLLVVLGLATILEAGQSLVLTATLVVLGQLVAAGILSMLVAKPGRPPAKSAC